MFRTSARVRESLRHLWRCRLRSGLFVCCAGLGAAGVIISVNFAAGGRLQVLGQIRRMGTNIVMVTAAADRAKAGRARTGSIVTTLRASDYDAIRRDVGGVARSSAIVAAALRLKGGEFSKVSVVVGCEPAYFEIKAWPLSDGAVFDDADMRRSARVALLGHSVASDLFGAASPIGERLFINRVPFVVGGVLSERGQGLDVATEDEQIYVPLTTAMRRLSSVDYFNAIALEIRRWSDMDRAAAAVSDVLNTRHRTSASRPPDFQVQNQKELVDTQLASSTRLAFLVRWVGWSGVLVSGIGVLAMAAIAVRDRITEIGTRRALGATRTDVFLQFAFEAIVLTAFGSFVGLGLGWLGTKVVAARSLLPFLFDRGTATLALGCAFLVNTAFSAWPAYRAARLDPVVALRHE